jgi:alanyl-tRNA synthetase
MNSTAIREAFLGYFKQERHTIVSSSPLVPGNDPTLLFTNAGMVQFKDVFLGLDKRPYVRATTSQRCVRAGGKHNDLENVGYTARHHTFFEMLGNFSFGDYFKQDAIRFSWTFLTEKLGIPAEKLWVTVFENDDEAEAIWLNEIGIPKSRLTRLGEKSNFWAMGDTGPCGPCSEIFYDHGEDVPGGPPGSPDEDGDRYIEIWNLVFMQFNRSADGQLAPLPKPSVDTGMGLERIAAVMQGVHSNYEIDLFQTLIKAAAEVTGTAGLEHNSLKVIADHIRSCAFLVTDGVIPSNEGRGYVLRRIIRRAIRHGHKLGMKDPFFHKLVTTLAAIMGDAYPELVKAGARVTEVLLGEELQFARTLDNGMAILEEAIAGLRENVIPGDTVFKLYDTYGFPVDLTADIARERGLILDQAGFDRAMASQKEQARAASRFEADATLVITDLPATRFLGYDALDARGTVLGTWRNGQPVASLQQGETGVLVLDQTTFYAESGGQVGDQGLVTGEGCEFLVEDTRKQGSHFLHIGKVLQGELTVGAAVSTEVRADIRRPIMLNHSATHLMHAALRAVLGDHVSQKGSLVHPDYLRFDFSHNKALTPAELESIENIVNGQILANAEVSHRTMAIDEARKLGAMALFGEKYGDEVRVISMGNKELNGKDKVFSIELCGGTHVTRTGDIGQFRIVQESGIAAGVRRIEAVTGNGALARARDQEQRLEKVAGLLKAGSANLVEKLQQMVSDQKALERELQQLKAKLASAAGEDLVGTAQTVKGIKVIATELEGLDAKAMRDTADQLKNRLGSGVVVLAVREGDKVSLVVGVTKDLTDRIKAGNLVNSLAAHVGGKGGGRPDMAMAGGTRPEGLADALQAVVPAIEGSL